jgi:hypothetical protein
MTSADPGSLDLSIQARAHVCFQTEGRRYLGLDVLARSRIILIPDTTTEAQHTSEMPALSA